MMNSIVNNFFSPSFIVRPHTIKYSPLYLMLSLLLMVILYYPEQIKEWSSFPKQLRQLQDINSPFDSTDDNSIFNYDFLNNITLCDYKGTWDSIIFPNETNFFLSSSGQTSLAFRKQVQYKKDLNLTKDKTVKVIFYIKDGAYIDKYIKGNFTLSFSDTFPELIKSAISNNNTTIELNQINTNISIYACEFWISVHPYTFENTNITISFLNNPKNIEDKMNFLAISQFSTVNINIQSKEFSLNFTSEMSPENNLYDEIHNYSFILTVLAFIEIYFIFKLLMKINENGQIGWNLDLMTIVISIVYKSFICITHFYLSISTSNDEWSYEYALPTIIYFISLAIFELRLLFFAWKTRFIDWLYTEPAQFRRKLFGFYIMFYGFLFWSLVFIKSIIPNYFYCWVFFSLTWIFQIGHSARTGTRPPFSVGYLLSLTACRLYLPIYLKAYDGNIFDLRPSYFKVYSIVCIVLIQMLVILLQKCLGAKFMIPKCWRKEAFNYYKNVVDINAHVSQNPDCVICLDDLKNDTDWEISRLEVLPVWMEGLRKVYIIGFCIVKWEKCLKEVGNGSGRKKYMITPCDHVFHSVCLEKWMEMKNECPYCKRAIPPVE